MIRARSAAVALRRLPAAIAVAMLAVGVTACGDSDDGDADTSMPAESVVTTVDSTTPAGDTEADDGEGDDEVAAAPSYTIVSGDTLSGIAGRAGVPLADLVAVNGWSDGADHPILPGDVIVLPAGATVPTAATTAPAGDGSGSGNAGSGPGSSAGGYRSASPRYTDGDTLVISQPLADGDYGADATSDGSVITFVLFRIVSGETCSSQVPPDAVDAACASPPLYEPGDGTSISVTGSDLGEITVINGFDANDVWSVDGAELARLIAGEAPASDAPDGFQFHDWAYLITVEDGEVVAAHQQFHS